MDSQKSYGTEAGDPHNDGCTRYYFCATKLS